MRYAEFCGRETSVIALGTMDFGGRIEESRAREFMDAYVEIGGNFIDTARIYGDFARKIQGGSEQVIGRWMEDRRCRERIVLGTKGGHPDPSDMHTGRLSQGEILDDMRRSLDNLRTDCVDIYWLHRDDPSRPVEDILESLTALTEQGMTRYVGVSNWSTARIVEANASAARHGLVKLYANQPQFSLARQVVVEDDTLCQMDSETYAMHVRENLPCVCFSSQAKGFLSKMDQGGEAILPDKARRRYLCEENLAVFDRCRALSAQTGYSINTLALAWLTSQPFPTFPIAGVSRMEHIEALREAGDAILTAEQRDSLRRL
ncbi:MAG: aldo/keto reductase [Clostridia bacterium]|nr:aldo/keto reductase [Clostridia bacterium]